MRIRKPLPYQHINYRIPKVFNISVCCIALCWRLDLHWTQRCWVKLVLPSSLWSVMRSFVRTSRRQQHFIRVPTPWTFRLIYKVARDSWILGGNGGTSLGWVIAFCYHDDWIDPNKTTARACWKHWKTLILLAGDAIIYDCELLGRVPQYLAFVNETCEMQPVEETGKISSFQGYSLLHSCKFQENPKPLSVCPTGQAKVLLASVVRWQRCIASTCVTKTARFFPPGRWSKLQVPVKTMKNHVKS